MSIADSGNASITHFFSVQTPYQKMRLLGIHTSIYAAPFVVKCFDPDFPDVGICEICLAVMLAAVAFSFPSLLSSHSLLASSTLIYAYKSFLLFFRNLNHKNLKFEIKIV